MLRGSILIKGNKLSLSIQGCSTKIRLTREISNSLSPIFFFLRSSPNLDFRSKKQASRHLLVVRSQLQCLVISYQLDPPVIELSSRLFSLLSSPRHGSPTGILHGAVASLLSLSPHGVYHATLSPALVSDVICAEED